MGKTSPAYNSPQGSFGSEGNLRPPIDNSLPPRAPQNKEAAPFPPYSPFDPASRVVTLLSRWLISHRLHKSRS